MEVRRLPDEAHVGHVGVLEEDEGVFAGSQIVLQHVLRAAHAIERQLAMVL